MNKVLGVIWENWIKPLALYAALWAGFHYWLDFDNKQSVVFALFFGWCYFGFSKLNKKTEKAEDFIPYRVSITIHNAQDLLLKYKLLKTEEEWTQLSLKETSVLQRGFNFTVLSLSKDGLPHLTWLDDYKVFRAGMPSFEIPLEGLELLNEPPGRSSKWSPLLYFGYLHGKGHGYTIALCVRDKWWEKNKTSETEKTEIDNEYHTGSVYLTLGTLPYGEIGLDYEARRQDRKTELTKFGWTIKDYHEPQVPAWDRFEVQNEYFSVSQQDCETDTEYGLAHTVEAYKLDSLETVELILLSENSRVMEPMMFEFFAEKGGPGIKLVSDNT